MEEKLFWIGILMGAYAWGSRRLKHKLKSDRFAAGWHALFCAAASFMGVLVLTISLDNRGNAAPAAGMFTARQLAFSSIAAFAAALWGLWSAGRRFSPSSPSVKELYLKEDLEWSETIFSAVLLASFMMYFFVQAFKIPSGSMRSTFLEGDHLFVNKFIYGVRIPLTKTRVARLQQVRKGDVLVFQFPSSNPAEIQCGGPQYGKDFIKRVIGLPGDMVQVKEGEVFINGRPLKDESYAQYVDGSARISGPRAKVAPEEYQRYWQERMLGKMFGESIRDNFGPVVVPPGQYFVMGDNRDRSCDSRYWGAVPEPLVKGKAWFIYWPPARMQGVR